MTFKTAEIEELIGTLRTAHRNFTRPVGMEEADTLFSRAADALSLLSTEKEAMRAELDAFPPQTRTMLRRGMPVGSKAGYSNERFPWRIFDHQQAYANHGQTLFRLAERGGLGWCEAAAIIEKRAWHKMDDAEAEQVVRTTLAKLTGEGDRT